VDYRLCKYLLVNDFILLLILVLLLKKDLDWGEDLRESK